MTTEKAEPVAWQRRAISGEHRIWAFCEDNREDHEFWLEQGYELRPLYATPARCDALSDALRQNIESKLAQLKHYRDHECQLDHARTIAEGRILQLGQVKHWIAALSETKPAQGDAT